MPQKPLSNNTIGLFVCGWVVRVRITYAASSGWLWWRGRRGDSKRLCEHRAWSSTVPCTLQSHSNLGNGRENRCHWSQWKIPTNSAKVPMTKTGKKSTVPFPPYDRKKRKWRQWFSPICLKEADANYNHLRMHYFTPIFYGKKWKIPQPGAPFWQSPVQAALAAVATKNSPGIKR